MIEKVNPNSHPILPIQRGEDILKLGIIHLTYPRTVTFWNQKISEWFPKFQSIHSPCSCCDTFCSQYNLEWISGHNSMHQLSCLSEIFHLLNEGERLVSMYPKEANPSKEYFLVAPNQHASPSSTSPSSVILLFKKETDYGFPRLMELGKLATLHSFVRGITHEISQPLGTIQLTIEVLIRKLQKLNLPETNELIERLLWIKESGKDIHNLIQRFRQALGKNHEPPDWHPISETLTESLKLFHSQLIAHQVTLITQMPPPSIQVFINPYGFYRIVGAILSNALEAWEHTPKQDYKFSISYRLLPEESPRYLQLVFEDNGPGWPERIDPADLISPFYSTKDPHLHCGLGLTVVQLLVTNWGGFLQLDKSQWDGAAVRIGLQCQLEHRPGSSP